jgi:hypothetical protein
VSLDRKDVRAKLDPEWHDALTRAAKTLDVDIGELAEEVIVKFLTDRAHAYMLSQQEFEDSPIIGKIRARTGKSH